VSSVCEFTKAFSIMVNLQKKLEKSLKILEDGEKDIGLGELSIGGQLNDQFAQIVKTASDLSISKKLQFLSESEAVYQSKLIP